MATNLEIKEIKDQGVWDQFVICQDFYTFLQSYSWGEFQKKLGNGVLRLGFYQNSRLKAVAQILTIKARRGSFYLCPHGPIFESVVDQVEVLWALTDYLKDLGSAQKIDFIRLNTLLLSTKENQALMDKIGYKFAPMHQHAETTWLLNIKKSEEELLGQMRRTTRYLIKRGEKEGVIVKKDNSPQAIEKFILLHQQHAKENNYEAFSSAYIKNLFQAFPTGEISLKFASYQGEFEAASVIIYFGATAAYYLAATKNIHPQFSPAYLLQWESIKEAKAKGCDSYNFWGISPDDNPKHPIAGVSGFKIGFGGYKIDFLHAQDYPLTKKYYLNWLIETGRRIKRGYYYIKP